MMTCLKQLKLSIPVQKVHLRLNCYFAKNKKAYYTRMSAQLQLPFFYAKICKLECELAQSKDRK